MRSEGVTVLLSVIVPVYNAEINLPRCLDSLLDQGLGVGEMEIVCIDDGSTDGSLAVLKNYAAQTPAIVVLNQRHSGTGAARNLGLEYAKGEIVTFCDADDYLIPNALCSVIKDFWNDKVDVLCHGSTTLDAQRLKTWSEPNDTSGVLLCKGLGRTVYERDPKYFVWNALISKSYIESHSLRFRPMVMAEDACFMLELMMSNPRTLDVSSNIYRYTVSELQVTRKREPQFMRECIDAYLYFFSRLRYYNLPDVLKFQKIPFYSRVLSANLTRQEFSALSLKTRQYGVISCPYVLYLPLSWIYRTMFVPFVLPRLARGK